MRYVLILFLAGCATQKVWDRPGASSTDFEMDRGYCQAQAFGSPGMYTMQVAIVFNACMRSRGWVLVDQ